MADAKKCDRCGKFYEHGYGFYDIDICPVCYAELEVFLCVKEGSNVQSLIQKSKYF